jgi:hypothetical protein
MGSVYFLKRFRRYWLVCVGIEACLASECGGNLKVYLRLI